jgi:hypothetical protein
MRADTDPVVTSPGTVPDGDERPLSFNQSSYLTLEWLAQLRSKAKPPVPMVLGLSLEGPVNVAAVEDALNEIVRRHEVLRASFLDPRRLSPRQEAALTLGLRQRGIADAGVFSQRIRPAVRLRLCVESLPGADASAAHDDLQRRVREYVTAAFDYTEPPLMRAALYTLDAARHLLVVVLHHLVADGWSMGVLYAELRRFYDCRVSGRSFGEVAPLALQYGDFARRQREQFSTIPDTVVADAKALWAEFGHALLRPADIPPARPGTVAHEIARGYQDLTIDPERVPELRALAKRRRVTTYVLALTAIAVVFHAYTGRTAVAWWCYGSNRKRTELEGLIGWLAHGRMFGVTVAPDEPVSDLIGRVRERVYQLYEGEELPVQLFWKILHDHGVAAPDAFADEYLSFDASVLPREAAVTLADGVIVRSAPRLLFANGNWPSLGVWSVESGSEWRIDCRHAGTRCDAPAVASFLEDLGRVLGAIGRTPGAPVAEIAALAARR